MERKWKLLGLQGLYTGLNGGYIEIIYGLGFRVWRLGFRVRRNGTEHGNYYNGLSRDHCKDPFLHS